MSQLLEKQRVARASASGKGGGTLTPNTGVAVMGGTLLGGTGTPAPIASAAGGGGGNGGGIECSCGAGLAGEHAKTCPHHPLRRLTFTNKLPSSQQHHTAAAHHHHHHHLQHLHHHNAAAVHHHSLDNSGSGARHGLITLSTSSHHHNQHELHSDNSPQVGLTTTVIVI